MVRLSHGAEAERGRDRGVHRQRPVADGAARHARVPDERQNTPLSGTVPGFVTVSVKVTDSPTATGAGAAVNAAARRGRFGAGAGADPGPGPEP